MYCRQCEQTAKGQACTIQGVCGKSTEVSAMLDLMIYGLKSLSTIALKAKDRGWMDPETDYLVMQGLFTAVTNVNFDTKRIAELIKSVYEAKERIKAAFPETESSILETWKPAKSIEDMVEQGKEISGTKHSNDDIQSLREILQSGLLGMAAYADHAHILGKSDQTINGFFYKALAALADDTVVAESYLTLINEFGLVNLKCMELLDAGNTETFGHPIPTPVALGYKEGPAIIVSGHDLLDLKTLLEQTEGKGINVYTHGEMLPGHGYPELKKYTHLAGHFGSAWQNQKKEFDNIPAAVLMTTNCIQEPRPSYKDRIFTTGLVAWPDVIHIESKNGKKDFSAVINKALLLGGFEDEQITKTITVGFARKTVLGVAGKVLELVASKKIKHFFLVGGCDGAKPGRNYYTDFAAKVPKDCLILTLACGKFRFNDQEFGDIDGIPRLLDCGQCNDAYSAIMIAVALAGKLGIGVNELPLSMVLSWYEQKAVCILLTLFSLGIKNIRLGPTLPAFVTPNVLKALVDNFNIMPIKTPDEDLKAILGAGYKNEADN